MSGETCSPKNSASSPTFEMIVMSDGRWTASRPWRKRAAPTPPARTVYHSGGKERGARSAGGSRSLRPRAGGSAASGRGAPAGARSRGGAPMRPAPGWRRWRPGGCASGGSRPNRSRAASRTAPCIVPAISSKSVKRAFGLSSATRNSESRSRSGSGSPSAVQSHERVLCSECVVSTATEFVSSPAGFQLSASGGNSAIVCRMSAKVRRTVAPPAARSGSGVLMGRLYYACATRL